MNNTPVTFDDILIRIAEVLKNLDAVPAKIEGLFLVRDLFGKVRITVPDDWEGELAIEETLRRLADQLYNTLGAHAYEPDQAVLFVDREALRELADSAREIQPNVFLADRLITGRDWATIADSPADTGQKRPTRFTLYSIKGGVGRSTTAAVLAWHLARTGRRVMVVDLDLESPGLSSALLEPDRRPEFGVVDWFVEDLVGQGNLVIEQVVATPQWAQDFEGDVRVIPAYGRAPGEYLAKLGRVYLDTDKSWTARLALLLDRLEEEYQPEIVVLESRSGLHDLAAATVTELNAQVLLFAIDSEGTWEDYDILFRHWQEYELAPRIRDRLSIVSALTPEVDTERYLENFRERAWHLFRDRLYDEVPPSADPGSDYFSFDLGDENAPHDPFPIHWNRGLAAGSSLRNLMGTTVEQAYGKFLGRFNQLINAISANGIDAP